jgi:hypothetical protein
MRGAMPPLLNTSSWCRAFLSTGTTLPFTFTFYWTWTKFMAAFDLETNRVVIITSPAWQDTYRAVALLYWPFVTWITWRHVHQNMKSSLCGEGWQARILNVTNKHGSSIWDYYGCLSIGKRRGNEIHVHVLPLECRTKSSLNGISQILRKCGKVHIFG